MVWDEQCYHDDQLMGSTCNSFLFSANLFLKIDGFD